MVSRQKKNAFISFDFFFKKIFGFWGKWAESFVIIQIYVRILSLKHHYFQFYQRKVPCFSSIRETSVRLTIIFCDKFRESVKDIHDMPKNSVTCPLFRDISEMKKK